MKALFYCLFVSALLTLTTIGSPAEWETVGGNSTRNGQTDFAGPDHPETLWTGSQSAWFGGQIYIDGTRLVTMRFQGISVAPIVCHDLFTGEELWSVDFEGINSRSVPRGFRDGQVYATNFQETGHDTLHALSAVDGSVVWASEKTVDLGIVWAVVFDSAGNLVIPGSNAHITKIDKADGHIIWDIARSQPNTGAEGLAVFGNTLYGWTGYLNTPKKITAWDLSDGQEKYSSAALPGDGDQETAPSIGPGGTIYALRDGGNLYALRDNGGGFEELWSVALQGTGPTVQFGIGRDSSVYVPNGTTLVRLDHRTGRVIDRSPNLITTPPLSPRISIDAFGNLFVINGTAAEGMLYALTPELEIIWSAPLPYNYYSGPAIGMAGSMAVAGNGYTLRVYNDMIGIDDERPTPREFTLAQNYPNPFNASTVIGYSLDRECHVRLEIYNSLGQRARTLIDSPQAAGSHAVIWDGIGESGQAAASGAYFYKIQTEGIAETKKLLLTK